MGGVLLAWLGLAGPTRAADGAVAPRSVLARRAVLLVPQNIETVAPELIVAIQAHAGSLAIELIVEEVSGVGADGLGGALARHRTLAARHGAVALIALELEPASMITIAITDARSARTIVRQVPFAPASRAMAAEASALIVRSTLLGLIEGGELGVVPIAPAQHDGAPEQKTSPRGQALAPHTRVGLVLGYIGGSFSEDVAWQSGLRGALTVAVDSRWSVAVGSALYGSVDLRSTTANLELRRHPFEAYVTYQREASDLRWTAEAGLLAEMLVLQRVEAAPGLEPSSEQTTWTVGVSARAGARWSVLRSATLGLLAGVDVMPWRVEYVARAPERASLQVTHLWRPRLELVASVPLW